MEPGRNPISDLDVIESQVGEYGGLDDRPRLVALNRLMCPTVERYGRLGDR
ncbi:MAG: hypothetical protein R2693_10110 [Nocardioidaceae bacterium]